MNDLAFALDRPFDGDHAGGENGATELLEHGWPADQVADADLVLNGDEENALGGSWPLTDEDQSRRLRPGIVLRGNRLGAGEDLSSGKKAHEVGT